MNVRVHVSVFVGGVTPMECQCQADGDEVGSIDSDSKLRFRVFTEQCRRKGHQGHNLGAKEELENAAKGMALKVSSVLDGPFTATL